MKDNLSRTKAAMGFGLIFMTLIGFIPALITFLVAYLLDSTEED